MPAGAGTPRYENPESWFGTVNWRGGFCHTPPRPQRGTSPRATFSHSACSCRPSVQFHWHASWLDVVVWRAHSSKLCRMTNWRRPASSTLSNREYRPAQHHLGWSIGRRSLRFAVGMVSTWTWLATVAPVCVGVGDFRRLRRMTVQLAERAGPSYAGDKPQRYNPLSPPRAGFVGLRRNDESSPGAGHDESGWAVE